MAATGEKRSTLPFLLGILAILALVPLGWWLFLRSPPPPVVAPPPIAAPEVIITPDAGPQAVQVRLSELSGTVEVRRAGSTAWVPASRGQVLSSADGVRTRDGSWAVMVGGETWEVRMEPGTEVEMGQLSASISQLLLAQGFAKATVRGGGRHAFEVKSTTGDALASTDGGVFTIASNGKGTVAVGAESGEVAFLGQGRVVIVRAGQESIIRPGQGPSAPAPIPNSLLLKVMLPGRSTVNRQQLKVEGDVHPGSAVEVGGQVVWPDEKGHFVSTVPLTEGHNQVEVRGRGVSGLGAASTHQVERDTTVKAPEIDRDLWK